MPDAGDKILYNWNSFTEWAEENGVSLDHEDDYGPWWDCWKDAHRVCEESFR